MDAHTPDLMPDLKRARRRQLAALALASVVLLAIAAAHNVAPLVPGKPVPGAAAANRLFHGLPQNGQELGRADAPVTLVEYGDLQCPACATIAGSVMTDLLPDVRAGRLRIVFRPVSLLGSDSERAALMAVAMSEQDRLWQFVDLFYANQRTENTHYVTDTFLRALAGGVDGTEVARALAARSSPAVRALVRSDAAAASRLHVRTVPAFAAGRTGATLHVVPVTTLSTAALESALGPLFAH